MAVNKFGFDPDYKISVTLLRADAEEARHAQEAKDAEKAAIKAEYDEALESVITMIRDSIDYLIEDRATAKYVDGDKAAQHIVRCLLKHNVPLRMIHEASECCRVRYVNARNNLGRDFAHCVDVASRSDEDFV